MNRMHRGLAVALSAVMWLAAAAAAADSALTDAVRRGDRAQVRTLLASASRTAGTNPATAAEPDGTTPLHWAARGDDVEIADLLLRAGADANASNRYGVPPLHLACLNGNAAMIDRLTRAGADSNASVNGETMLMTAARSGRVDAVTLLLDRGADVNARESWRGQTALMWAAAEGHAAVVRVLTARGADVHARTKVGFTPFLFAVRQGKIDAAVALLGAGANLNDALRGETGGTTAGAGPARPSEGVNAFLLAAGNAHYELAALLLDRGADPNAAPRGWTALHQLTWVRKAGIAGSNDPAPEGSGSMTSLEFARKLVAHGAEVNAKVSQRPPAGVTRLNMIGGTPFLLAARTADAEYMRLLVELGADPLMSNADGTTPLMVAAGVGTAAPGEDPGTESEVLEAVQLALKLGGDLNAVDENGETVMHGAASKHVPSVVRFLADAGARIDVWNRPNKEGFTPLRITEGIHRSMSIISSPATAAVIREIMARSAPSNAARP